MYGDFRFPDNSEPCWESFNWLQKEFLHWLNQERTKCILTFPVVSACLIYQDNKFLDNDLYEFICKEYSEGNSFFTYISDSADSLSSCCRLSSKLEKPQFNFTNGQLSEMTGSKNVITLNMNRIVQDWYWKHERFLNCGKDGRAASLECEDWQPSLKEYFVSILERVYKYQTAYNECLKELFNANMLPAYSAGFINLKKQYLTIGINGLNQAAEFLLLKCNKNDDYRDFCNLIFTTIKEENQKHKTPELMFNTEFTPCESAAIKLYNRDKADGYWVPKDTNLYASYIYKPNDAEISVLDKFILHGSDYCGDNLDGGSAAHINLDSHLSVNQYKALLNHAAEVGCKYFTFNIPNSECEDCGYITKSVIDKCPKCGSSNISLWDRVIGYLTKITNWSEGRQKEQKTRIYHKKV
jgi:ribonucleoside-triphosphate reductase